MNSSPSPFVLPIALAIVAAVVFSLIAISLAPDKTASQDCRQPATPNVPAECD
jgi:hypothetical protein